MDRDLHEIAEQLKRLNQLGEAFYRLLEEESFTFRELLEDRIEQEDAWEDIHAN